MVPKKRREETERQGGAKSSDDDIRRGGRRAAKARSVRRWTRAARPTRGPVRSGAGMPAEANGIGADLVKGTVDVSQPVGEDGVRVAEDMPPEVEGE